MSNAHPNGLLGLYNTVVLNMIMSAGESYATTWNQAALADMPFKKSNIGLPVSKKSSETVETIMAALEPIVKAFGLKDAQALVDIADALEEMVRASVSEGTSKKRVPKPPPPSSSSTSPAPPTDFPSPTDPWVMATVTNILKSCAEWVLRVRPNESNSVLYSLILEICSILAHCLPQLTGTRGGNGLRAVFQSLFNEYSSKGFTFNFADGLSIQRLSEEDLKAADRRIHDAKWGQCMVTFTSRIAKVPLDSFTDEDGDDMSMNEFVKEQLQTMLAVRTYALTHYQS